MNGLRLVKNSKSAGSNSVVGELIKYGGKPMCEMLLTLFNLVWDNDVILHCWRECLIVSFFEKADRKTLVIIEV